ncbi:MAG: hypothetical protein JRN68_06050 [Nitrososphaerota archaeon]|nr:hypothetical protein [Nitrososphaerota archaeon]
MNVKMYNVNDVYKGLIQAISNQTNSKTKLAGLKEFCSSNNINYKSASLLIETMKNLHPSLVDKVIVSRGGSSKNFIQSLAAKLNIPTEASPSSNNSFTIPYSFVRFIARLDQNDQEEFVNRWKKNGLEVDFSTLDTMISRSKIDGFELAYKQVFATYACRLEIQHVALILASMRSSKLVEDLQDCGYELDDVKATVDSLVYAGMLKNDKTHKTYELSSKFLDMLERAFDPLPTNAVAIWLTTMFDSIGVLRVNANKTRVRQIVKAVKEKVESYETRIENQAPILTVKK